MKNKGFTLVEILIASAIALIVGIFLMGILANNNGLYYKQSSLVSEGLSLNDAVSAINNYIMQAGAVAVSYPEISPLYTSNSETLVLKLPAYNGDEMIDNVFDYIVLYKDPANSKILKVQIFPGTGSTKQALTSVLTTILHNITFSYLDKRGVEVPPASATSVGIDLTVLSKTGSIGSSRSSKAVTNLRNF
ncbi:MAG: prepilin-type N-terminal cleavage/methylation domain-containing protein [Candidatus Daviesbacteria bacterium]|nr:prepilin-type N-terminal cleavage/methylation domain-containing protein [Candidatus Daviesbacteria bacterium]